jgi:hypothetical protein
MTRPAKPIPHRLTRKGQEAARVPFPYRKGANALELTDGFYLLAKPHKFRDSERWLLRALRQVSQLQGGQPPPAGSGAHTPALSLEQLAEKAGTTPTTAGRAIKVLTSLLLVRSYGDRRPTDPKTYWVDTAYTPPT